MNNYPNLDDFQQGTHIDHSEKCVAISKELRISKRNKKSQAMTTYKHVNNLVDVTKDLGRVTKMNNQDYSAIHQSLSAEGALFEDPTFQPPKGAKWKRPTDICDRPLFRKSDYSRLDVIQGAVANCWFATAVICLTLHPTLLEKVVPSINLDNAFDKSTYRGIFLFRFWNFGNVTEVVIDDRLPVSEDGEDLLNMKSSDKNEFWSALLEKAFAKFCGGYDHLSNGKASTAMQDLTGGVTLFYNMDPKFNKKFDADDLFDQLVANTNDNVMMVGDSFPLDSAAETNKATQFTHSYAILKVVAIELEDKTFKLICLRNAWGIPSEYDICFTPDYPEYYEFEENRLKQLGVFDGTKPGDFWIDYDGFVPLFSGIQGCNVATVEQPERWNTLTFNGAWTQDIPSGSDGLSQNPIIEFEIAPKEDQGAKPAYFSVQQFTNRDKRSTCLNTRFSVFQRPSNYESLTDGYVKDNPFGIKNADHYMNLREVTLCVNLKPGTYAIVPSRYEANSAGKFRVRVFSTNPLKALGESSQSRAIQQMLITGVFKMSLTTMNKMFFKVAIDGEINWADMKKILDKCFDNKTDFLNFPDLNKKEKKNKKFWQKNVISGLLKKVDLKDENIIINCGENYGFIESCCKDLAKMVTGNDKGRIDLTQFQQILGFIAKCTTIYQTYADRTKKRILADVANDAFDALNLSKEKRVQFPNKLSLYDYLKVSSSGNEDIHFMQFIKCAAKIKLVYDKFIESDNPTDFQIKNYI